MEKQKGENPMQRNLEIAKYIILSSRPIYWLMHIMAAIYGAIAASNQFTLLDWKMIIVIVCFGFGPSLFIYGINDAFDYESDNINPRKGGLFGLQAQEKNQKLLILSSLLAGVLITIPLVFVNLETVVVGLLFLFFLGFYSAPPLRFKNYPFLDAIIGGAIYAGSIFIFGYALFGGDFKNLFHNVNGLILIALGGFCFQSIGSILDEIPDKQSSTQTAVTILGHRPVIIYNVILIAFGILVMTNLITQL